MFMGQFGLPLKGVLMMICLGGFVALIAILGAHLLHYLELNFTGLYVKDAVLATARVRSSLQDIYFLYF